MRGFWAISIFLNTSIYSTTKTLQTGAEGLTLTAATRVIVIEPEWNPKTDDQASARAYRFGQKEEVWMYRMITALTFEEHITCLQLVKRGLEKVILEETNQFRHCTASELRQLLTLKPVEKAKYRELKKFQFDAMRDSGEPNWREIVWRKKIARKLVFSDFKKVHEKLEPEEGYESEESWKSSSGGSDDEMDVDPDPNPQGLPIENIGD